MIRYAKKLKNFKILCQEQAFEKKSNFEFPLSIEMKFRIFESCRKTHVLLHFDSRYLRLLGLTPRFPLQAAAAMLAQTHGNGKEFF